MPNTIATEIERYLRTGDSDPIYRAWPGSVLEAGQHAHGDLRGALVSEVRRLSKGRGHPAVPAHVGNEFTRGKVEPMVRGLFRRAEQDVVLAMLERSVVYVTNETIESLLLEVDYDKSAWDLANMYLRSVGAEMLGDEAMSVVGMSESTTCYVAPDYFTEKDPFADFIVHEAAHVFHNCKRRTIGLPETRSREWLLELQFSKRETFAYSCEAYSRIMALAENPTHRRELADEFGSRVRFSEERVDFAEVANIVAEATRARNGWKAILARCAPTTRPGNVLAFTEQRDGERPNALRDLTRLTEQFGGYEKELK